MAEQRAYDQAKADFDAQRYPAALAEFQAFLGTYGGGALADLATFYLGRSKYEQTPPDYAGAIATWRGLLSAFPASNLLPSAQYWIGRAYFQSGNYVTARAELQKQLATYPANDSRDWVGVYLARCDFETGGFAATEQSLTDLIASFPNSVVLPQMFYWRGRARWEQQSFSNAQTDFDAVVTRFSMNPLADNASYWSGRSLFSQALLAPTPTPATWSATIASLSGTDMTYPASNVRDLVVEYLGRAYWHSGDFANALSTFNRQLMVWPNLPSNWAGHYWRGRTLLSQAVPDGARAIADFDVVINTGSTSLWYGNSFEWKARTQAALSQCPDAAATYSAMKAAVPASAALAQTCTSVKALCPAQVCP